MENLKKSYKKLQHTGNENGWNEPIVSLGVTSLSDEQAEELNSHFPSTGTKYELTDEKPYGEASLEVTIEPHKLQEASNFVEPVNTNKTNTTRSGKKATHKA